MDDWVPLQATTLKENVTNLLRQSIIDGTIPSGEELNQAQIAERLGISRGPVREALGQLEQEGLIRSVPYKGVIVTPLTPTYVRELYSLRSALETFALREGMARGDLDDVASLRRIVDAMRKAAKDGESRELARLDLRFHSVIIQMARHHLLERTWTPLKIGVQRCLHTRHSIYRSLDEVVGSHPELLDAIVRGDVEEACSLLHQHIIDAGEKLCEVWLDTSEVAEAELP
jgi:GntR family transcriptional regulator, rspAB operon transcriptional repressor